MACLPGKRREIVGRGRVGNHNLKHFAAGHVGQSFLGAQNGHGAFQPAHIQLSVSKRRVSRSVSHGIQTMDLER